MIWTIISFLLTGCAVYLILLYFKRSATQIKVPGPRANPLLGNALNVPLLDGQFYKRMHEMHLKYGDIFKIEFPFFARSKIRGMIMISSPDLVKQVWNDPTTLRPEQLYHSSEYFGSESYFITDGEQWSTMRKFFQHGFNYSNIQLMIPKIHKTLKILLNRVDKELETGNAAIPMHLLIQRFALDNDGLISFGMPFGAESGEFDNAMADIWKHITTRMRAPFEWWNYISTEESRKYQQALKLFRDKIKYIIGERRRIGVSEDDRDFLSMMLRAQESGEIQFTEKQIIDQCFTFLNGGTDTLSSTLTSMLYSLAINPEVEAKVIEEIDSILGDKELPDWDDINKLQYCGWVVKETLRIFPPVYVFGRKLSKPTEIGGYLIPTDYDIGLCVYAVHRLPKYWVNPDRFDPERWRDEKSESANPYLFLPFTAGPRNCQGHRLALIELRAILATLYKHYKFRVAPDQEINFEDAVVLRISSLMMHVLKR